MNQNSLKDYLDQNAVDQLVIYQDRLTKQYEVWVYLHPEWPNSGNAIKEGERRKMFCTVERAVVWIKAQGWQGGSQLTLDVSL